ncbi:unnamed protein product [Rotaria socialis]|uniref:BAH domain-containing protein n=1 Tax=Rotaria socialis TaxID=392032 RepID=A0A817L132_9BILA|nr:unnamed protein product [Rotaria socialis]CAF3448606.1 unnamed protein product [Rotaria socialis]CAF4193250.1 unnamed protein product [Rotaria socialis]CAF4236685.1 unnamed protein product [Rotaria socialis]
MSRHVRAAKTSATSSVSPSKSKQKSDSIRKVSRNVVKKNTSVKKSSPTKLYREPTSSSSTLIQPRQKRLSSLTATALVQYCNSILSPSRKLNRSIKSTPVLSNNSQTQQVSKNTKTLSRKRQISNDSAKSDKKLAQTESQIPARTRREASSRASAMIMQQNEIERSRYNYSLNNKHSASTIRRQPSTKTIITIKDNIPSVPASAPSIVSIPIEIVHTPSTNIESNNSPLISVSAIAKYPLLTEATLAEHNRVHETVPLYHATKRDSLIKWTQELDSYDRLSPPYLECEISSETNKYNLLNKKSTASLINDSKAIDSMNSHASSYLSGRNHINSPTFLFPSTTYPFDLHSYYSVLPCWQYSTWPFQSSLSAHQKTSLVNLESKPKKLAILNSKEKSTASNHMQTKEEALTFHLHTHHHHHIHNSSSSSAIIPLSSEKSSSVINKDQDLETETILKSKNDNLIKSQSKPRSSTIENDVLNLSINNKLQSNEIIIKTTRRKSSPTKRRVNSGVKSNSSPTALIREQVPYTNNSMAISPRKTIDSNESRTILPVLSDQNLNANVSIDNKTSPECVAKRRSVSAATTNSIRAISLTDKNIREKRTHSASNISARSKSSANRKRSYSPSSIALALPNKNVNQRKKQKISHYWILFGKSEQKLVSIHADKPPVFRECYSSIRHIIEKDVINSNDCIILRPETGANSSSTPYSAKVKWFWKEPTTDEIQMSLIWYYHPEHTELSARAKERFLPNELLASRYSDCVNAACIEDKCYVLNLNEYNRYCLREKSSNFFEHAEPVGQLKSLLNKNTSSVHHRSLPAKTVGNQNIFFCRYVYDYRANRILKNPNLNSYPITITTSSTTTSSM